MVFGRSAKNIYTSKRPTSISMKFMLVIPLVFLLNCWETTIRFDVKKNGKSYIYLTSKSDCDLFSGYDLKGFFSDLGLRNEKVWKRRKKCYYSGNKYGDLSDFRIGKKITAKTTSSKDRGFFSNTYVFETYLGQYTDRETLNNPFFKMLGKNIKFNYIVQLPGEITSTTGRLSKDKKRASFYMSLYSLSKGSRRLFVQSKDDSLKNITDANYYASLVIEEKRAELYEVETRLAKVRHKMSYEKRFNSKKKRWVKSSNKQIVILMNKFLRIYHKKLKKYPETKGELLAYLEDNNIDVDDLPEAIGGSVEYNAEKRRFFFERNIQEI